MVMADGDCQRYRHIYINVNYYKWIKFINGRRHKNVLPINRQAWRNFPKILRHSYAVSIIDPNKPKSANRNKKNDRKLICMLCFTYTDKYIFHLTAGRASSDPHFACSSAIATTQRLIQIIFVFFCLFLNNKTYNAVTPPPRILHNKLSVRDACDILQMSAKSSESTMGFSFIASQSARTHTEQKTATNWRHSLNAFHMPASRVASLKV